MSAEYLYLAFALLLARALLGSDERPMSARRFAALAAVQVLALAVMSMTAGLALVAAAILAAGLGAFVLERNDGMRNLARFASSSLLLAGLSFVGPPERSAVHFAEWAIRAVDAISRASVLLVRADGRSLQSALAVLSGGLFVATEANNLTRWMLLRLKVTPAGAGGRESGGEVELRRGKMIGIAERLLIFYFVLTHNLAAIGFVLAAKGFTRFRELDDRDFAEYVLIGTLLSASGAIAVGLLTSLVLAGL
jgi:hypothetical protein